MNEKDMIHNEKIWQTVKLLFLFLLIEGGAVTL